MQCGPKHYEFNKINRLKGLVQGHHALFLELSVILISKFVSLNQVTRALTLCHLVKAFVQKHILPTKTMYLYFIVISMTLVIQVHGHTDDKDCKLKIVDKYKNEFENQILSYLDKDSTTLVLEYELNFSNVGPDFDLINRSNPYAYEPWRWYRTKGIASKLLFNQSSLFGMITGLMNKKFKVHLTDTPAGCLYNNSEDLESHITNFLLRDFDIPVNELRTTVQLSIDVAICTARMDPFELFFRCCEYEIHSQSLCYSVKQNLFFQYGRVFLYMVTFIASFYIPLLLPVTKTERKGNLQALRGEDNHVIGLKLKDSVRTSWKSRWEKKLLIKLENCKHFFGLKWKDSVCKGGEKKSISKIHIQNIKKLQTLYESSVSKKKKGPTIYSAEIQNITLKVVKDNYVHCDETFISGIGSFIYNIYILLVDRYSKRNMIIIRVLLCIIFVCGPNILTLILVESKDIFFIIGSMQVIIISFLVYDAATEDNFQKAVLNLKKDLNESWKQTITVMKKSSRACLRCTTFLFPLIGLLCIILISTSLVFKSPVLIIFYYIIKPKTRHICLPVCCVQIIQFLMAIIFCVFMSLSIHITDLIFTFVAIVMFYKPFIITILSGVAVFFVYLRTFVTNVSKELDENIRNIVEIIQNENVLPTINKNDLAKKAPKELPENNENVLSSKIAKVMMILLMPKIHGNVLPTESSEAEKYSFFFLPIATEEERKVNFKVVKNCLCVTYKACIPFILKKNKICVSKRLLMRMMSRYFFKILIQCLVATFFLANIVVVVIGFSIYDYISTIHQVFITLISGIIPLVVKMMSEGGGKESENSKPKRDINEIKRTLAEKLESYEEEVEIADLDLQNWKEDESYTVDLIIKSSNEFSDESSVESSKRIIGEGYLQI